ncbi:MAG: hypothetical protein A2144_14430 [Chloroflexi bacterium RBG_16_50_9]|nr:MAG: hypothetical protein A2144_14430 [Chloroflexi bacterium RBG_16_50_9]
MSVTQVINVATRVTKWLAIIATVCLAALMLINIIDIAGSKWFRWSLPGAIDFSEELMVALTLLPIAYVTLERGHINITMLEERVGQVGRFAFKLVHYAVGTLVMGFFTWRVFLRTQYTMETMQQKPGIEIPIWPANMVIVIAYGFLALVWLLLFIKTVKSGLQQ